ncbi:Leukotriene A-4 hydrolase-like protein [Zea mays]|uniref:Leukotriene A-4 hydrolase-like protein n=1 Tax=Zea mays TaxID=4577 RepID=A0A1D6FVU2_MAIZE|nr:Leukotriene A-4 hydrolase-like protein [Zea mays]AQK95550.1 Leukotriene A-4 hydrolase-like protein [Zea mays]AQK95608.1 Leukotriene A-4 hydrolase-like protein [Zea mays]
MGYWRSGRSSILAGSAHFLRKFVVGNQWNPTIHFSCGWSCRWGQENSLEFGTDKIEMHVGAVQANDRALVVDDLIATRVQLSNLSEMDDEALDQGDGGWIKEMEEVAATATTSRSIMPFRAIQKGKPLSVSLASRRSPPLSSRTPGARRGHKRVVPRRREEEGHVA